jgi:hypothetical protein
MLPGGVLHTVIAAYSSPATAPRQPGRALDPACRELKMRRIIILNRKTLWRPPLQPINSILNSICKQSWEIHVPHLCEVADIG